MRKYMAEIVCTVGSCDKQMVIRRQEKLEPSCCAPFTYYMILFW